MRKLPQLLIAAPTSGAGKTTVSRGLMALLTAKGFRVQMRARLYRYEVSRSGLSSSFL